MAKEIQDTLGEVDEMPMSESTTADDELEGDADSFEASAATDEDLPLDPTETKFDDEVVPGEDDQEAVSDEDDAERDDSAPAATLALWLADELRPSPSKSLAPAAPHLESSETLAPVAVPPEELSEEELAVLRPGHSRAPWRTVLVAGLGALAAVFLIGYLRQPTPPKTVDSTTAAEPTPGDPTPRTSAAAPTANVASSSETTAEEPAEKQLRHWLPSTGATEADDSDDPMRGPRGPSVGRFPDLPPEFWSEIRLRELERRGESAQQPAADPLEP